MKNLSKGLLLFSLCALAAGGVQAALEVRTPFPAEKGPLRYVFDTAPHNTWSLNLWTTYYGRYAHKSFKKHSTKTKELTELFFGKSEFRLNEIFPNSYFDPSGEYYNPYMQVLRIKTRAAWNEQGLHVGGRFAYPIWEDKGKLGIRLAVPFKRIEVEKLDNDNTPDDRQLQNVRRESNNAAKFTVTALVPNPTEGKDPLNTTIIAAPQRSATYRLDFVDALIDNLAQRKNLMLEGTGGSLTISANQVTGPELAGAPYFALVKRPEGYVPKKDLVMQKSVVDAGTALGPNDIVSGNFKEDVVYKFKDGSESESYSKILAASYKTTTPPGSCCPCSEECSTDCSTSSCGTSCSTSSSSSCCRTPADLRSCCTTSCDTSSSSSCCNTSGSSSCSTSCDTDCNSCMSLNDNKAQLWLIPVTTNAQGSLDLQTQNMLGAIESAILPFDENPYEFMKDRGWQLETARRAGMGDIDLDLFYEHTFGSQVVGELMLGFKLPTGGSHKYAVNLAENGECKYANPYKPRLGNGDHVEIKLGGMIAYEPVRWMNMKLDMYYSFVLEAKEERAAAFKGACIKNFGPRADADVDWGYFIMRLDFSFAHPDTKRISSIIGYELYLKQSDHIKYKCCTAESWGGREWVPATDGSTGTIPASFQKKEWTLSNKLAKHNTSSIGHKIRCETSYRPTDCIELYAGAVCTFAGKNLPRDSMLHAGYQINF